MWHDLPQRGYTRGGGGGGVPSHRANSRRRAQMWVTPRGKGGRMRCPSLRGSADAPHNCQAFSFIRPRSDTYRGVQPEAIAAASPPCRRTHTPTHKHTQSNSHLEWFLKKGSFFREKMWWPRTAFFSGFGFWTWAGSIKLSQHERSRGACANSHVFHWTQRGNVMGNEWYSEAADVGSFIS